MTNEALPQNFKGARLHFERSLVFQKLSLSPFGHSSCSRGRGETSHGHKEGVLSGLTIECLTLRGHGSAVDGGEVDGHAVARVLQHGRLHRGALVGKSQG